MNPSPEIEWIKLLGDLYPYSLNSSISLDEQGYIYLTFCSTPENYLQIAVLKMDPSGNIIWSNTSSTFNPVEEDGLKPRLKVDTQYVYVCYYSYGQIPDQTNKGNADIIVFKLNRMTGQIIWNKQESSFNTSGGDFNPDLSVDLSGNIYVSYETRGTSEGGERVGFVKDIVLFKLSDIGETVWIKQQTLFNTSQDDTRSNVGVDRVGNIYVSYETFGDVSGQDNMGESDIVLFKMNTDGDFLWVKQNSDFNTIRFERRSSLSVDSDGNSYLVYQSNIDDDNINLAFVVLKMDTNGNIVWIKKQESQYTLPFIDILPSIVLDTLGNIYITFHSFIQETSSYELYLFELDSMGDVVWSFKFGSEINSQYPKIAVTDQGDIYISFDSEITSPSIFYQVGISRFNKNSNNILRILDMPDYLVQILPEDQDEIDEIQRRYHVQFGNFANQMNFKYMIPIQFYLPIQNMDRWVDDVLDHNRFMFSYYDYQMLTYYI
jgi:hypothetical protein